MKLFSLSLIPIIFGITNLGLSEEPSADSIAAAGLKEISSSHLRLITDIPLDDEIRQLPIVFDLAMEEWSAYFASKDQDKAQLMKKTSDWKAVAFLIGDRQRFLANGFIKAGVPDFKDGYQAGSWLYFMEQPSPYYRRHLLLHEGTHWFMTSLYGSAGPPWYMEGMAERLATHEWDGKALRMAVVPINNDSVPYWGRIKLLRDDLEKKTAPTLEEILHMEGSARLPVDRYAWSWAVVMFFSEHPEWKPVLDRVVAEGLNRGPQMSDELMERLKGDWVRVRVSWNGFISDIDYGFRVPDAMPKISKDQKSLKDKPITAEVQASQGWQSAGVAVKQGDKIRIAATGKYVVEKGSEEWVSEPQGVSLQYFNRHPIGKLVGTIARVDKEIQATEEWTVFPIGRETEMVAPYSGILVLKINDNPAKLGDNAGSCKVRITRAP